MAHSSSVSRPAGSAQGGPSSRKMNPPENRSAVAQLCPACGLCCNGVLFADGELQAADDAQRLAGLGLVLQKRRGRPVFSQPCSCFDGSLCRIYEERPARCRAFYCGLVLRVESGELTVKEALRRIRQVRQQVAGLERKLRRLGNAEAHLPLTRRYAQVAAEPLDLSGGEELLEERAALMLEVNGLMQVLHRDFLR